MPRLLVLIGIVLGFLWFLRWFSRTPPAQVGRALRKAAMWAVVGGLVLAAATGRLSPVFAAIGALIPVVVRLLNVVQMLPGLQRMLRSLGLGVPGVSGSAAGPGGGSSAPGGVSEIRTPYLAMRLDHATGAMDGDVLDGPFAGRALADLGLDELLRMLELYREADSQSATLLEAYLDRERDPHWRERYAGGPAGRAPRGEGRLNESEAWAILGLAPGADAAAIRAAHRRLIQKLHPDRGGSDYLAAKINEAKRVLLKESG